MTDNLKLLLMFCCVFWGAVSTISYYIDLILRLEVLGQNQCLQHPLPPRAFEIWNLHWSHA